MDVDDLAAVPCVAMELPAIPASVTVARNGACAFAADHAAAGDRIADVALAVTEAVGNAVRHAYPEVPGDVQVLLDIEDGELELVVTDQGQGFTTRPATGLGVGLAVMRDVSDAFEVRDRPLGGVEVWMRFAIE